MGESVAAVSLGKMLPATTTVNFTDAFTTNAKQGGKRALRYRSFQGTNRAHILSRQFSLWPALPTQKTFLLTSIGHIVEMGAQEQMIWIDAKRHIAPMADELTMRNRPVGLFPGKPVGHDTDTVGVGLNIEPSVALAVHITSSPQPASVSLVDVSPKANDRPSVVLVHAANSTPVGGEAQ